MYEIYADGVKIFSDTDPDESVKLVDPKLTLSAGAAGSLSLSLPPTNAGYKTVERLTSTITVLRDGDAIWSGRVLSEKKDFWGNRQLFCEGALAYLNDTIAVAAKYTSPGLPAYLASLLNAHNAKVSSNREISLNRAQITDPAGDVDRYTDDSSTYATINKIVDELGGVMQVESTTEWVENLMPDPSSFMNGAYFELWGEVTDLEIDPGALESGAIDLQTGEAYDSTTMYRTGFVAIYGDKYHFTSITYSLNYSTSFPVGIAFYDERYRFISAVETNGGSRTETIPSSARYARFTALDPDTYGELSVSGTGSAQVASRTVDQETGRVTLIAQDYFSTTNHFADFPLKMLSLDPDTTYTLTGCPSSGGEGRYGLCIGGVGESGYTWDYGSGVTFSGASNCIVFIRLWETGEAVTAEFWPMLEVGDHASGAYVPGGSSGPVTANRLSILNSYPNEATQTIDLGENLLDFTRDWDSTDYCTVILPRGARLDSEDSNLQEYLDIAGCTAPTGYSILNSVFLGKTAAVTAYGRLEKVVDFSDIGQALNDEKSALDAASAELAGLLEKAEALEDKKDELYDQLQDLDPDSSEYTRVYDRYIAALADYQAAQTAYNTALSAYNTAVSTYNGDVATERAKLLAAAKDYLESVQFDDMSLDMTAVDMNILDRTETAWNLLDIVTVKARPFFGEGGKRFAILGMSIPLDRPEQTKYTLGPATVPKKRRVLTLTKQQNQAAADLAESVEAARTAGQDYTNSVKTTLEAQAEQIVARVEDTEGDLAEIVIDVDGIESRVTNSEGDISTLEQTATSLTSRVTNAEGDISTLEQTATDIKAHVADNSGNYTVMTINAQNGVTIGNGSSATNINGGFLNANTVKAHTIIGNTINLQDDSGTTVGNLFTRASNSYDPNVPVIDIYNPNGGVSMEAYNGTAYFFGSDGVVLDTRSGIIWMGNTVKPNSTNWTLGYTDYPWADVYFVDYNGTTRSLAAEIQRLWDAI